MSRCCSVLALVALVGCGDAPPGLEFPLDHDPLSADHPFPSSRALDPATGRLRVPAWVLAPRALTGADHAAAAALLARLGPPLAELDGAGTTAELLVPVRGAFDAAELAAQVVVLDAADQRAQPVTVSADGALAIVAPSATWQDGHTYVVVIARGELDCGPSAGLARLLDAPADADRAEAALVAAALAARGLAADQVCQAFSFRVQSIAERYAALRRTLLDRAAAAPPSFTVDAIRPAAEVRGLETVTTVDRVIYGSFTSPELRADGHLVAARVTGDAASPDAALRFALSLPAGVAAGARLPVVMGLHGLGGSIDTTLPGYAEVWGEAGYAYLTIDGVGHGSRAEGFATAIDLLLDAEDPRRTLAAFVQTTADLVQLRALLRRDPEIDGVTLAGDDVSWSGGSYGGINGLLLAAVEPDLRAVHVEACGGPWRDVIRGSSVAQTFAAANLIAEAGLTTNVVDPEMQAFMRQYFELAQWIVDAGDVSSRALRVHADPLDGPPRRVLMQYWVGETLMPNPASRRLADALVVPVATAQASPDGVAGVWPYPVEDWGVMPGLDAHGAFWHIPAARQQAIDFVRSGGTAIAAPVP